MFLFVFGGCYKPTFNSHPLKKHCVVMKCTLIVLLLLLPTLFFSAHTVSLSSPSYIEVFCNWWFLMFTSLLIGFSHSMVLVKSSLCHQKRSLYRSNFIMKNIYKESVSWLHSLSYGYHHEILLFVKHLAEVTIP